MKTTNGTQGSEHGQQAAASTSEQRDPRVAAVILVARAMGYVVTFTMGIALAWVIGEWLRPGNTSVQVFVRYWVGLLGLPVFALASWGILWRESVRWNEVMCTLRERCTKWEGDYNSLSERYQKVHHHLSAAVARCVPFGSFLEVFDIDTFKLHWALQCDLCLAVYDGQKWGIAVIQYPVSRSWMLRLRLTSHLSLTLRRSAESDAQVGGVFYIDAKDGDEGTFAHHATRFDVREVDVIGPLEQQLQHVVVVCADPSDAFSLIERSMYVRAVGHPELCPFRTLRRRTLEYRLGTEKGQAYFAQEHTLLD